MIVEILREHGPMWRAQDENSLVIGYGGTIKSALMQWVDLWEGRANDIAVARMREPTPLPKGFDHVRCWLCNEAVNLVTQNFEHDDHGYAHKLCYKIYHDVYMQYYDQTLIPLLDASIA
jgi:LSD1 subclass zinc finger protein